MNKTILKGRIGGPPVLRLLPSGAEVVHFSVATRFGEHVDWHRCMAFGEVARDIAGMAGTGDFVWVEGSLRTRESGDASTGKPRRIRELVISEMSIIEKRSEMYSEEEPEAAPSRPGYGVLEWEVDPEKQPKLIGRGLKCL